MRSLLDSSLLYAVIRDVYRRDGKGNVVADICMPKEGQPLMRYRTRDLCVLDYSPCECGRTHVRMKKPVGRTGDMLIIRGVNVFPSQIGGSVKEQH